MQGMTRCSNQSAIDSVDSGHPRALRRPGAGRTALAILCAFMVLFAATLRLAHTHTPAEQESGRCQICSSIHTAAPAAVAPIPVTLHEAPEQVVTPAPENPVITRTVTLSDRAPPALA